MINIYLGDQTRNGEERISNANNVVAPGNSRRLRLFGVNLDCVITEPAEGPESVQDMNGSMFAGIMNQNSSYAPHVPNYS